MEKHSPVADNEEHMKKNEILKAYGTDYKELTKRLLTRADLSGAIAAKCNPAGQALSADAHDAWAHQVRIGIKPNLVSPTPASFGATTHPEVVEGIIEYLQEQGYSQITIMEGSWVGDKTTQAFEYCGYNDISRRTGVPLIDSQQDSATETDCAGLKVRICDCAFSADFLINVPVLKGHAQTKITCALKNMKGLIPNSEKRHFHTMGLHKPIAHLNKALKQDFIVIDHICGDPDFEDGGHPVVKNCVMAALDPVLVDSYVCRLLGYQPSDVPYVVMAEELGVGSSDLSAAHIITVEGVNDEDMPKSRRLLNISYNVDEVESCSACYGLLMEALDRLEQEGLLSELQEKICIGQGWRGKSGRLGVGTCTKDFEVSVPGCPPKAEEIYQVLKQQITHGSGR